MARRRRRRLWTSAEAPAEGTALLEVVSPCTGVCELDAAGLCVCGRTLDEITAWAGCGYEQKRAIAAAAAERRSLS